MPCCPCEWLQGTFDCGQPEFRSELLDVVCNTFNIGCSYIKWMGLLGALLSFLELSQIVSCVKSLPCFLKRKRVRGLIVSTRTERDIKLITNVFTIIFYLMLSYGMWKRDKYFMYPWFVMQTMIMFGESLIFTFKLIKCEIMNISRQEFFCSWFTFFNWLQVFCYLRKECICRCN